MLTTLVIPTSGPPWSVASTWSSSRPGQQPIGVVPRTNTLDRALTVWENLYFHGRFFGMGVRRARAAADGLL